MLFLMASNSWQRWQQMPSLSGSDAELDAAVDASIQQNDTNDLLYQLEASLDYDPGPRLGQIRAPLLAINWADDLINPPELGVLEREIRRVPQGRAMLLPFSAESRGHDTQMIAAAWKQYLVELLGRAPQR